EHGELDQGRGTLRRRHQVTRASTAGGRRLRRPAGRFHVRPIVAQARYWAGEARRHVERRYQA
ncbi:MAG: hypothetical protein ACRC1K_18660, partial [Planctomycetia bacterium]